MEERKNVLMKVNEVCVVMICFEKYVDLVDMSKDLMVKLVEVVYEDFKKWMDDLDLNNLLVVKKEFVVRFFKIDVIY